MSDASRRLSGLPRSERCHPTCPGWFVGVYDSDGLDRIQACDECNAARNWYHCTVTHDHDLATLVSDDECASLPIAKRALARAVCGRVKARPLRAALMREHALKVAIGDALAWLRDAPQSASVAGAIVRLEKTL